MPKRRDPAPKTGRPPRALRRLVVVLGDQLDRASPALDDFDPTQDAVWMAEVSDESTHVWSAKQRTVLFLSAMRHFAQALRDDGMPVVYRALTADVADTPDSTLADELGAALEHAPGEVVMVTPGDYRVREALRAAVESRGVTLRWCEDTHFLCSTAEFAAHAKGRKQLRMEYFYRDMRRRHGVLMQPDGREPVGDAWNFDTENRASFPAAGPGDVPETPRFLPDAITREVIAMVDARFGDHPGSVSEFGWPVTREQALEVLERFVSERLEHFGRWQDAMWAEQPWLYHSHVSAAMNLKLLNPREVIRAAEQAYTDGHAPLPAVEGFIRQVLGWREYVRGLYWLKMPEYGDSNALHATVDLPAWFWTGDVEMRCLQDAITQTLEHGYAHHIQRLMVTGLYALMLGVDPRQIHAWYLAVYVDAVEWVELPNVIGMSQYADGGVMASKPYVATGKYIDRMSNYCKGCRYDPAQRTGPQACPYTTLYWDFLARHETLLAKNPRMSLQVKNLARIDPGEMTAIAERAQRLRSEAGRSERGGASGPS